MSIKNKKIAVIGGGYTGLTCALHLSKAGYKVTVIEKSGNLGGLAGGFNIAGASLEKAYHHIFKTDTDIIQLSRDLGILDKIKWCDSSTSIYYKGTLYPFKGALDLIKFTPLSFQSRVRTGLVTLYLQLTNNWLKFEKVTAYEWMRKHAGQEVMDVIWAPLLRGKFNTYHDKISMAWLWARIHVRAQSREAGGEKLGYFSGGFQTFTNALIDECKNNGVSFIMDTTIDAIESDRKVAVIINGKKTLYDYCASTIPSGSFSKLIMDNPSITKSYIKKLNSIPYIGARILIFSSSQEITPYYWNNINDETVPFVAFINHTRLIDRSNYQNKFVYYIATYMPHDSAAFNVSDNDLKKEWLSSLSKVFPKFDKSLIEDVHCFRFSNAQHIVELDYKNKIPDKRTPLKNVFLSNFSQIYPEDRGTNFAVRDGALLAKMIATDDSPLSTADQPTSSDNNLRQFVRFGSVGLFNTVIDIISYWLLINAGLPIITANMISTSFGLMTSFILNRSYTFKVKRVKVVNQMVKFLSVTLVGLWIIQPIVIHVVKFNLQPLYISLIPDVFIELPPKLLATVISLLWNYILYKKVVFKNKIEPVDVR